MLTLSHGFIVRCVLDLWAPSILRRRPAQQRRVMTNDGKAHVPAHVSHHIAERAIPFPGEKQRNAPLERLSLLASNPVYGVEEKHETPPPGEARGEVIILLDLPCILENL